MIPTTPAGILLLEDVLGLCKPEEVYPGSVAIMTSVRPFASIE